MANTRTILITVTRSTAAASVVISRGVKGDTGDDSVVPGPTGPGVPDGGTTGQRLAKIDATNQNTEWVSDGGGDMTAAVYDPTSVVGDAFDMDNMVEGTGKILTIAERAEIAANTLGRSFSVGRTNAIRVNARVKSNDQFDGTCAPRKTPAAVLSCHEVHKANPAPRKYQCLRLLPSFL